MLYILLLSLNLPGHGDLKSTEIGKVVQDVTLYSLEYSYNESQNMLWPGIKFDTTTVFVCIVDKQKHVMMVCVLQIMFL